MRASSTAQAQRTARGRTGSVVERLVNGRLLETCTATPIGSSWPESVPSSRGAFRPLSGYTSVCSAIFKASSTSMPKYLAVLSSLECPSRSWTARRFLVRRLMSEGFVRLCNRIRIERRFARELLMQRFQRRFRVRGDDL